MMGSVPCSPLAEILSLDYQMYLGVRRVYKRAREWMLVMMLVHTEEAGNETCVSNVRNE